MWAASPGPSRYARQTTLALKSFFNIEVLSCLMDAWQYCIVEDIAVSVKSHMHLKAAHHKGLLFNSQQQMVRDPCNIHPRNPSHNPTLETNTRSPRIDLSLSLSQQLLAACKVPMWVCLGLFCHLTHYTYHTPHCPPRVPGKLHCCFQELKNDFQVVRSQLLASNTHWSYISFESPLELRPLTR